MAMAGRRKLTIDGTEYSYLLKRTPGPLVFDSAVSMRLTVELKPGSYVSTTFRSTTDWTREHEDGLRGGLESSFTPKHVSGVIRALEFNKGVLPSGFQLEGWRYVEPKPAPEVPKVAPARPRLGVGTHLSIDDLRALAFEQPALSIDFVRARAHMGSCRSCRYLVEQERAENPLLQPDQPTVT